MVEGDCIHPSPRGERTELLAGMGDRDPPGGREGRGTGGARPPLMSPFLRGSRPPNPGYWRVSRKPVSSTRPFTVSPRVPWPSRSDCGELPFLVLGSGNYPTGMITAFQPPAALAAGFSARRGGVSGLSASDRGTGISVFLGVVRPPAAVHAGFHVGSVAVDPVVPLQRHRGSFYVSRRRGIPRSMGRLGEGVLRKSAQKVRVDLHPSVKFSTGISDI